MIAVVIPTNRPNSFARWNEAWRETFTRDEVQVFPVRDDPSTWDAIRRDLGDTAWIIPRKTDCIRSYGFLQAYRAGAEVIVTLDDDCYPDDHPDEFLHDHVVNLNQVVPRWVPTVKGIHPRGLPYGEFDAPVVISMGTWAGIPDVDGVTQRSNASGHWDYTYRFAQIVPLGTFYPMSGMNLAFRRVMTPAMYFLLMGTRIDQNVPWGYDRFGDIWAGILSKKICDHLGFAVHTGPPWIVHERASDPLVNMVKEEPGRRVNEWLWKLVGEAHLTATTVPECYRELAEVIRWPRTNGLYWEPFRSAMKLWAGLFDA